MPTPLGRLPLPLAAVDGWDIAVATHQIRPLAPALAAALRPAADHLVPRLRAYGVFAPARTPADPRDETAALLAFLGRDPEWVPPAS